MKAHVRDESYVCAILQNDFSDFPEDLNQNKFDKLHGPFFIVLIEMDYDFETEKESYTVKDYIEVEKNEIVKVYKHESYIGGPFEFTDDSSLAFSINKGNELLGLYALYNEPCLVEEDELNEEDFNEIKKQCNIPENMNIYLVRQA